VRDLPLPAPVMSYLFPHDLRLVGTQVDEARAPISIVWSK